MTTPDDVIAAARGWIGTPFKHQHRAKGIGVDCAGLVIGVARELGLVEPTWDVTGYGQVPDGVTLAALCDEHMDRLLHCAPGCVVLVAWGRGDPQHLGIVGTHPLGGLSMIHAERRRFGRVIEQQLVFSRAMRLVAAFAFRGVA